MADNSRPSSGQKADAARAGVPPWPVLLRALREVRGYTQAAWADWLGLSSKTVRRWEHGEGVPDALGEARLLSVCTEKGLFRPYASGPLAGLTLTPQLLQDVLSAARLGGASDPPPLGTLRVARHNLPVPRSRFIGREAERAHLRRLVLTEGLVTLTGIGGCGKTRLALAAAAEVLEDFPDGVFFVDLAALADPTLLGQAVAGALDLHLLDTAADALADALAGRRLLLILDNCEHLLDACADLAEALLERCPHLHLLATSREPLGLDGEQILRVPSLEIETEAVALFVDRARAVRPDLRLEPDSEATIAAICRRLDGLPLAIELAAARAAHLAPLDILQRLNDRFRLLVGGRRRVQRQQTLTAALDWSYALLTPAEQQLLRRLAVFRGSFNLSAAEAICDPGALNLLGSLVAKSLVTLDDHAGTARYRLLESVRLYAEEKLAGTGEAEHLRSAHRDWYLGWIESLPLEEVRWFVGGSALAAEADNLTAALEWCQEQGRYDLCARIAARMAGYWFAFLRLADMMVWWRVLDAGLPPDDREHRAMALLLRSRAGMLAEERDVPNDSSARAAALAEPTSWIAVEAQYIQGIVWSVQDPPRSDRIFEDAFAIDAKLGMIPRLPFESYYLSRLRRTHGRDEALALLNDWRTRLRGSPPSSTMAAAFALYGDTTTAAALLARTAPALLPMERFMDELAQAVLASAQGQYQQAYRHLATLASVVRDHAVPHAEAGLLTGFAKVALDRGDHARAARLLAVVRASAGAGRIVFRTHFDWLIYAHTREVLRSVLDAGDAHTYQADAATITLAQAIDAELARCRQA